MKRIVTKIHIDHPSVDAEGRATSYLGRVSVRGKTVHARVQFTSLKPPGWHNGPVPEQVCVALSRLGITKK